MKATQEEISELLERHGIAPVEPRGTDAAEAARGGWIAALSFVRSNGGAPLLTFEVDGVVAEALTPPDAQAARALVAKIRGEARLPHDASFERMLADLFLRAAKLFAESGGTRLDLESLHLHPTAYHIGKVTLELEKPLHLQKRLDPDSHDRHAVFTHRHGSSARFPK